MTLPTTQTEFEQIKSGKEKIIVVNESEKDNLIREDLADGFYRNGEVLIKPTGLKSWVTITRGKGADVPKLDALVSLSYGKVKANEERVLRLYIHDIEGA